MLDDIAKAISGFKDCFPNDYDDMIIYCFLSLINKFGSVWDVLHLNIGLCQIHQLFLSVKIHVIYLFLAGVQQFNRVNEQLLL